MGSDPIRVGVVGLLRGMAIADHGFDRLGLELVAVCDASTNLARRVGEERGVPAYTNFDTLLDHDLDAVILANHFHQHAPLAIRALTAGKHVMSETTACLTMAEGVELTRAWERSGAIYMLAENNPYRAYNQEMRRLFRDGRIGDFRYAEGEYIHPMSARTANASAPGHDHWRNWLPVTYYSTHSLAPVMYITDTMPTHVSGFVVPHDPNDHAKAMTARRMDTAGLIVTQMDNGALVKLLQHDLRGKGKWVRIHGNAGLMETSAPEISRRFGFVGSGGTRSRVNRRR
jgi:predicted dehydrogenase